MTKVTEVARAMGETLIPGSTSITARFVISPELIDRLARAAIAAMGEPSQLMIEAGSHECWGENQAADAINCWRAMIAAALEE